MRFVIVTGMSGAGKRTAMKILEDVGYFCVDNLPIQLMQKFIDLAFNSMGDIDKVALGVDIRSGDLSQIDNIIDYLKINDRAFEILFLEARDETLVKRFKETRRSHPLVTKGRVDEGLARERQMMAFLKKKADYIIETDSCLQRSLEVSWRKYLLKIRNLKIYL